MVPIDDVERNGKAEWAPMAKRGRGILLEETEVFDLQHRSRSNRRGVVGLVRRQCRPGESKFRSAAKPRGRTGLPRRRERPDPRDQT